MKPRIFINIHYLEIGGVETSLIGLLQALSPEQVEVDLFVNNHSGEMMQLIPDWVNLLPEVSSYAMIERPMLEVLRRGFMKVLAARIWAKIQFNIYQKKEMPKMKGLYSDM